MNNLSRNRARAKVGRLASVYIISDVLERYTKVGISEAPTRRLASLQTANPHRLHLIHNTDPFDRSLAEEIEGHIHAELRSKAMAGEWFRCSPDDALEAMIIVGNRLASDEVGDVI